nr:zinc finger, CCHC-type [Tanacetum cinerariifolium]
MHFLLSSMSVVYVLATPIPEDGGDNPTAEQVRKRAKWDNDDYVCKGLILNGMSGPLFDIYHNIKSSKELWESLEAKYMADDASSKKFLIGNGKNVSFWYDKWDVEGPLCLMINKRAIYNARLFDNNTVADMVRDGPRLCSIQCPVLQKDKCDKGSLLCYAASSTRKTYDPRQDADLEQNWNSKMSILQEISRFTSRLFFQCDYSNKIWKGLKGKINADKLSDDWIGVINDLVQMNNINAIRSIFRRIVVAAVVYYVWQERNKRIMANEFRSADVLFEIILEYVKLKITSLKVKLSVQVRKVAKEWDVMVKEKI